MLSGQLRGEKLQFSNFSSVYFQNLKSRSLGYFTWYDVFLNGIGGLLGLTIFWGVNTK